MNRRHWQAMLLWLGLGVMLPWLLLTRLLDSVQYGSGWMLVVMLLLLALYRLRKALPFLRLGAVSRWRRLHNITGVTLLLVLLLHITSIPPQRPLEMLLLALLLTVAVSGLLLVRQARRLPQALSAAGGNQLLGSIPAAIEGLRAEARERMKEVAGGPLEGVYAQHLQPLLPGGDPNTGFTPLDRDTPASLSAAQRRELRGLLLRASELQQQSRLQLGWRRLLTLHAGVSYALLLFVSLHVLQAYRLLP